LTLVKRVEPCDRPVHYAISESERVQKVRLIAVLALLAVTVPVGTQVKPVRTALVESKSYPSDRVMLRGELDRFASSIDPSSGSSIYTAWELGNPLARAIFATDDPALKRALLSHAAGIVRKLPTLGELGQQNPESTTLSSLDRYSSTFQATRLALTASPRFDGLPLPRGGKAAGHRVFPLREGGALAINTGNIQQFGFYLSTLVRLGAADPSITGDPRARADLQLLADYLVGDYLRLFWTDTPAWHWSGPFPGGMRERTLARLEGGPKMANRKFFRGFLDYDVHLMAAASDLAAANRSLPGLIGKPADRALVDDVVGMAWRVLDARVDTGADGAHFAFDRGYWDDNPVAQYGGCQDRRVPARACPLRNYTTDISHAQRWPDWLESFAAGAPDGARRTRAQGWRRSLAQEIGGNVRYRDGRVLLPNFLDGRDGWFLTTESSQGHNAHPPSSLTGWAMRYGALGRLAPLDPRIAAAQDRFCATIASPAPADVRFRMANYGEPEANPANGIRPMSDEYGAGSVYDHICRMVDIATSRAASPRAG
jgi:hypothetical protein